MGPGDYAGKQDEEMEIHADLNTPHGSQEKTKKWMELYSIHGLVLGRGGDRDLRQARSRKSQGKEEKENCHARKAWVAPSGHYRGNLEQYLQKFKRNSSSPRIGRGEKKKKTKKKKKKRKNAAFVEQEG